MNNLKQFQTIQMKLIAILCLIMLSISVHGKLKIQITEGEQGKIPIIVLPFTNEPVIEARRSSGIIASDLAYSGLFSLVPTTKTKPMRMGDKLKYEDWSVLGVEKLVRGAVVKKNNKFELTFELYDINRQQRLLGSVITVEDYVRASHYISDKIYKEITGIPGIFNTRLAFTSTERLSWRSYFFALYVSDADGKNALSISRSSSQMMSPTWSPDGKKIAYVSYKNVQPEIIIQTLTSAKRESLGQYTGISTSPDWSQDGEHIAYVSSAQGTPDIYIINIKNMKITSLTTNNAIDTEPTWTPDNGLIFTSDRSGNPQLYFISAVGEQAERITFNGTYNSDADVSPDGKKVVFLSRRKGKFSIALMDIESGNEDVLVTSTDVERPRFSGNGQLISYLQDGALGLITLDGRQGRQIPSTIKNARGIAWSPLL